VTVRRPYAHEALLAMDPGGDERAPGAAVTLALCGSWEHPPPCPLAPHHTRAERDADGALRVRVLFAAEPADEERVRTLVEAALDGGAVDTPDGGRATWRRVSGGPSEVRPGEREHAGRLTRS
jgi:hypothetical protein